MQVRQPTTARSAALLPFAACAWALTFAGVHAYWLAGGTAGLPRGMTIFDNTALLVIDIVAIPLCLITAVLALALTRPWPQRQHRLVRGLAWATSALLVIHALPAVPDWAALMAGRSPTELPPMERFSILLYEPFFIIGGPLYGMAAARSARPVRRVGRAER